jgi:hypothetical protein
MVASWLISRNSPNESEDLLLRKTQNVPFMFYQTLNLSKTISRISRVSQHPQKPISNLHYKSTPRQNLLLRLTLHDPSDRSVYSFYAKPHPEETVEQLGQGSIR